MPHRLLVALTAASIGLAACAAPAPSQEPPPAARTNPREPAPPRTTVTAVQSEVMSFTDTFISAIAQEWNRVSSDARASSSPEGLGSFQEGGDLPSRQRRAALAIKLANTSSALAIASSPNPYIAVADLVTMVSLQRMVLETPPMTQLFGAANAAALAETYREQEERAWRMARSTMTASQQEDLASLINEWRRQHPDDTYVSNVRLEDFSGARQETIVTRNSPRGNLLSLIWLDPLASLDPAEREVQKTRLLGERMFYYASRSPQVLKWHVESLYHDLLRAPEFKQALGSVENANHAAERIAGVAERLPQDVAAERAAALKQFFELLEQERRATVADVDHALTGQRDALIRQLGEGQDNLRGTLREYRDAADTTDRMAGSVTTAIRAADTFAARFTPDADAAERDPARGSSIAEVRDAAAQAGDAADRLTTLARSIDELLNSPGVSAQADTIHGLILDANAQVKEVIHYAFARLLILLIIAPFTFAAAALLYRRLLRV